MYRLMFDTNILIDAIVSGRPESDAARELLIWCAEKGGVALVCPLSLKDTYYVLNRDLSEKDSRAAVKSLMQAVRLTPVGMEECDMAIDSDEPDFEDGIIRACAELNDADFFITRDRQAYTRSKIKRLSAKEFLHTHGKDKPGTFIPYEDLV